MNWFQIFFWVLAGAALLVIALRTWERATGLVSVRQYILRTGIDLVVIAFLVTLATRQSQP
jgi:hypothetical protein